MEKNPRANGLKVFVLTPISLFQTPKYIVLGAPTHEALSVVPLDDLERLNILLRFIFHSFTLHDLILILIDAIDLLHASTPRSFLWLTYLCSLSCPNKQFLSLIPFLSCPPSLSHTQIIYLSICPFGSYSIVLPFVHDSVSFLSAIPRLDRLPVF